jgi:hypothetical protein
MAKLSHNQESSRSLRPCGRDLSAVALALAFLPPPASAQDAFFARWQSAAANTPAEVQFEITLPNGKSTWNRGEIIPLQLMLSSKQSDGWIPNTGMFGSVGGWNSIEEFHVDPADAMTGPPVSSAPGGIAGSSVSVPQVLGAEPFTYTRNLNDWIRPRPGSYRLYVTTKRACRTSGTDRSQWPACFPRGQSVEIVSNILTFEVRDPPPGWASAQLAAALRALDAPDADDGSDYELKAQAARIVRSLETPEAAEAMARRLANGRLTPDRAFRWTVLGSPYRDRLLPLLSELFEDPGEPVTPWLIETLAELSVLSESDGPMPPFPQDGDDSAQKKWRAESQKRWDAQRRRSDELHARLAARVGQKAPAARAISLNTLITLSTFGPGQSLPPWHASAVARLAENFRDLPVLLQRDMLLSEWDRIGGTALIPVLRSLYENPPEEANAGEVQDLALRRLYQVAHGEGRKLILEQLRKPTKRVEWTTLASLNDTTLPELNDAIAARLEGGEYVDRIIVRYADEQVLDRVKAAYEKRQAEFAQRSEPPCLSPLHFYFLRVDADYGERELRRVLNSRGPGRCLDLASPFHDLGRYAMSPALEKVAIEYLNDSVVVNKNGAAEILGKYGSAAAEKPLWSVMEFFHEWWKGKEELLEEPVGEESRQLEATLRTALARAGGWVLDEADLRRLRTLCVSDWCRQEVDSWIQAAQPPLAVELYGGLANSLQAQIGWYDVRSREDLQRKLSQFPVGTQLRWSYRPADDAAPGLRAARDLVEEAIRAAGVVLLPAEPPTAQ